MAAKASLRNQEKPEAALMTATGGKLPLVPSRNATFLSKGLLEHFNERSLQDRLVPRTNLRADTFCK